MKLTHIPSMLIAGIFMLSTCITANAETKSNDDANNKATQQAPDYPEKLIHDFPYIYSDTAYTSEDYNVVVRAVWMAQRGRKTKVTSLEQLPVTNNETCVKFISFESKSFDKADFTDNSAQ